MMCVGSLKPAGAKPLPEVWCSLSAWAVSLSPRLQAAPPAHTVFAVNSRDTSFYKLTCDPVSLSVPGTSPSRPLASQPQENIDGDEFQQIVLESRAEQYLKADEPSVSIPYQ